MSNYITCWRKILTHSTALHHCWTWTVIYKDKQIKRIYLYTEQLRSRTGEACVEPAVFSETNPRTEKLCWIHGRSLKGGEKKCRFKGVNYKTIKTGLYLNRVGLSADACFSSIWRDKIPRYRWVVSTEHYFANTDMSWLLAIIFSHNGDWWYIFFSFKWNHHLWISSSKTYICFILKYPKTWVSVCVKQK